jgi:hypothetical protein
MFHVPAHKNIAHKAAQIIDYGFRAARFAAEEAAFRAKWTPGEDAQFLAAGSALGWTPEEDAAFAEIPATTYERGGYDVAFTRASPYNHRACNALCAIGTKDLLNRWYLFDQIDFCIDAPEWIPTGGTRRSMFADDSDPANIVHTPCSDRD